MEMENITECEPSEEVEILNNNYFQMAVYTMYAIIFLVALIGNGFVCYIVLSSPRMRTVTNYFIMNLAVGDIMITIFCVPFTSVSLMKQKWPFGGALCPVVSYSMAVAVFVSAYTLVAISIDKYMIIMWPLKPRISKMQATYVIASVWIVAGLTVLPTSLFTQLVVAIGNVTQLNSTVYCYRIICREDYSSIGPEYETIYTSVLLVLQYVVPFCVMIFTYTSIAIVIWCHRIPGEAENSRDQRLARSKRKMIKMMVTVVFVYSLCWLPYNLLLMISTKLNSNLLMYLFFPIHGLAMSHACYNPIIYCYMNSRFRDGLVLILKYIPYLGNCVSPSPGFRHTGNEGTESTELHRNNTCTTYISMKRKNFNRNSSRAHQLPVRSASVMRHFDQNGTKRIRYSANIMDEEI